MESKDKAIEEIVLFNSIILTDILFIWVYFFLFERQIYKKKETQKERNFSSAGSLSPNG